MKLTTSFNITTPSGPGYFRQTFGCAAVALLLLVLPHTESSASSLPLSDDTTVIDTSKTVSPDEPEAQKKDDTKAAVQEEALHPDWAGVRRDFGIIVGLQLAAVAITYVMPESFSGWSPEQKRAGVKKYGNNFVNPVLDKDKAYVNYILHPYWGATYYTRGRERGLDRTSSFFFSAALSTLYEFGTECIAERPSIQDLIVTPVAGSLLGAFIFEPWRNSIKQKQELKWYDHTALVVTDPLGVLTSGIEKIFGLKPTITVNYSAPQIQKRIAGSAVTSSDRRIEAMLQFPLD